MVDDLAPADHVCRVIDAFVDHLKMDELGFEHAEAWETGRSGYDPRDLLKFYLYGYLHALCSSRRLEAECRRMYREAVTAAGAQLVQFAQGCG